MPALQSIRAFAYGSKVGAAAVHVMAGFAEGPAARETFLGNLRYALSVAPDGMTILIEPLNRHDAPGYFLRTTDQAAEIIAELSSDRVRLMFDCYHVGRTEGDIGTRLGELLPITGHIQFASVPDRAEPDRGEIDYGHVFQAIERLGWQHPLGAEYRPATTLEAGLGWLGRMRG